MAKAKEMEKPDGRIDALDAVRGYAIIAVLVIHCSSIVGPSSAWLVKLAYLGPRGVQAFYIVSGFVMFLWLNRRPIVTRGDAWRYTVARVARLAPMFWLSIPLTLRITGFGPSLWAPSGIGPLQIILNILMLHTWWPDAANSVVAGGWSVGVEVTFYMLAPFLVLAIRTWWMACIAFIAAAVFTDPACHSLMSLYTHTAAARTSLLDQFAGGISFPPQMPAFASGILLYFAWRSGLRLKAVPAYCLILLSAAAAWLLSYDTGYWFSIKTSVIRFSNLTLFSIAMLPGIAAMVFCPSTILNNPVARYIGRISYSIYLIHFAMCTEVIKFYRDRVHLQIFAPGNSNFFIYMMTTLVACVAASTITYFLIEEPARRLLLRILTRKKEAPVRPAPVPVCA